MTAANAGGPEIPTPAELPRRDWILLPTLSVLTICLMVMSTELIARHMFPALNTVGEDCMVFTDSSTGPRGRPNSVCWEKLPDGQLTKYEFNSCGDRAGMDCGPKPAHTYRIVMVGSSFAAGMRVPREETFAALLPAELSRRTQRKVELYNEGMPWRLPHIIAGHFNEVLAAQPDMILWILTPKDISKTLLMIPGDRPPSVQPEAAPRASVPRAVRDFWKSKQSGFLLRHLLYESRSQYVNAYLMREGDTEYLKQKPSAEWQRLMRQFDSDAAAIEAQADAAGVPLVAVLLPERAQAAMISMGKWPAGFDPYKFDAELRSIIVSHGGIYIDVLPRFRDIPDPEKGYFSVDGHPDAYGHAFICGLLASELTLGAVSSLRGPAETHAALRE